jgi:hypothetical protein
MSRTRPFSWPRRRSTPHAVGDLRWNRQPLGSPAARYQWRRGSVALHSIRESFVRHLQQDRLRVVRACERQNTLAGIRRRVRVAERRRSDRALRRGRRSLADVPVRAPELSARPVLSVHRRVDDGQPARVVEPVLLHVHETERLSEIWRVVRGVLHVDQSV